VRRAHPSQHQQEEQQQARVQEERRADRDDQTTAPKTKNQRKTRKKQNDATGKLPSQFSLLQPTVSPALEETLHTFAQLAEQMCERFFLHQLLRKFDSFFFILTQQYACQKLPRRSLKLNIF
jgi:hypothetical protein